MRKMKAWVVFLLFGTKKILFDSVNSIFCLSVTRNGISDCDPDNVSHSGLCYVSVLLSIPSSHVFVSSFAFPCVKMEIHRPACKLSASPILKSLSWPMSDGWAVQLPSPSCIRLHLAELKFIGHLAIYQKVWMDWTICPVVSNLCRYKNRIYHYWWSIQSR